MRWALTMMVACASAACAQVASIQVTEAFARVQDGQRASARMRNRFGQRVAALEKKEAEWRADRETLDRESRQLHGWWLWRHRMKPAEKARRQKDLLDAGDPHNGFLLTEVDVTDEIVRLFDLTYPVP